MKINKKVIESAVVAVFALTLIVTSAVTGKANTNAEQYPEENAVAEVEQEEVQVATKEKAEVAVVATPEDNVTETVVTPETPVAEEPVVVSEWATKLMPNVDEYLNIRAEANSESELVGKLHKGASADILERGAEWSKITSGSVTGWVKNEYCVFDEAAEAMAYQQGTVYATALTGGLRVRAEANLAEDVTLVHVMEEGEKLKVDLSVTAPQGWVAVRCDDVTGFVSAEFVSVELKLGKAISIEEELAAIKKAEEEAAAERAAVKHTSSPGTVQKDAVAASYDDLTLLGALIQCEAGGECYEGQVAVGAVVMNRLRAGFAGSISGVIYQSGQFTPAYSGALERRLANGVSGSCLQAAQEALNGADNVNGALYFRRVGSKSGIVIGNHVFY